MPTQTTNLFRLEDLEDAGKTSELEGSDLMRSMRSQTGSRATWSSPTGIWAALGPSVPSCLGRWNVGHFGLLRSRSPTGTCHLSSSSWTATGDCSWTLDLLTVTTPNTR
jgi:hypothetical protein